MPRIGFYCTTKWAVEALHESLAQEVKPFRLPLCAPLLHSAA
jgi:NAD(P)-dependent dehydrogenase (short-subunit alcohol dehydrogenase family)